MLLSMTGYGEAHRQADGLAVAVELRTINSRYFKISIRAGEGFSLLEPLVENVVREQIKRGTVQVNLRIDRLASPDDYCLNADVLNGYIRQLTDLQMRLALPPPVSLENLLQLPGVVREGRLGAASSEEDWPLVSQVLSAALDSLAAMRRKEGQAMAADLLANRKAISAELDQIAIRAPLMVEAYRGRLEERLNKVLAEFQVTLNAADLIREVSIFAERSDISEEIVRLKSHLDQFDSVMAAAESSGRKLEFLIQEMFREVNTIGSKSSDVAIARHVIEIKAAIERLREMVQNVE